MNTKILMGSIMAVAIIGMVSPSAFAVETPTPPTEPPVDVPTPPEDPPCDALDEGTDKGSQGKAKAGNYIGC